MSKEGCIVLCELRCVIECIFIELIMNGVSWGGAYGDEEEHVQQYLVEK